MPDKQPVTWSLPAVAIKKLKLFTVKRQWFSQYAIFIVKKKEAIRLPFHLLNQDLTQDYLAAKPVAPSGRPETV